MLGKILTISDTLGQTYVDGAREIWRKKGYDIIAMDLQGAIVHKEYNQYNLIAFTMNSDNQEMFLNCMRIIRAVTYVPIVLFPYEDVEPGFEMKSLNEGADRVIPLPVDVEHAIINCISIMRIFSRSKVVEPRPGPVMQAYEGLLVDMESWVVLNQGHKLDLTPREYGLLRTFMEHKGQVLTGLQIYRQVWGEDIGYSDSIVSNLVARLRRKLKLADDSPDFIKNIRGVGYKFGL